MSAPEADFALDSRCSATSIALHERSIVFGTGGRSTEPGEIQFAAYGRPILQLFEDGRILVNGELVDNDPRVADAFREWLDGVLHPLTTLNPVALGSLVERLRQQVTTRSETRPMNAWERSFQEAADTIESIVVRASSVPTMPVPYLRLDWLDRLTLGALVARLRQQAGPDPYPNSYGGLFKEAADVLEALAAAAEKGEQA